MTCIVAQKTETGVLMGAENTMTENRRMFRKATPKLWRPGETPRIVAGIAGACRFGNVLRSSTWPENRLLVSDPDEAALVLGDFLRPIVDQHSNDKRGAWLLIAIDREIYYVDSDAAVTRVEADYCALGSGEDVAIGALFALSRIADALPLDARTKITIALDATCEHVTAHRPPFHFLETIAPKPAR